MIIMCLLIGWRNNLSILFPMTKPYLSIEEILEIFQINLATAKAVLKKHKVDTFRNRGKLMIHAKDFYKAYTRNFNPSLFRLKIKD